MRKLVFALAFLAVALTGVGVLLYVFMLPGLYSARPEPSVAEVEAGDLALAS